MIDLLNFLSDDYHLKSTLQNARVELWVVEPRLL